MRLVFGVVNVAYADKSGSATTGDVAQILEDKYHIMRVFYELKEEKIAGIVTDALVGSLKTLAQKGSVKGINVTKIDRMFRHFLEADEMSKVLPARLQSIAAKSGAALRFEDAMNRKGKKGARPAFIDTGLYSASFRAWIAK
jgi:hypothetical protein